MRRIGITPLELAFPGLPNGAPAGAHCAAPRCVATAAHRMPKPALIVIPTDSDAHPDRRVVAMCVAACRTSRARYLHYPVWPAGKRLRGSRRLMLNATERPAERYVIRNYRTRTGMITDDPFRPHDDRRPDRRVQQTRRNVQRVTLVKPITLAGFDAKFVADNDPWATFSNADEALKRSAILHAIGSGRWGRVLELAAGNGSNSAAIAPRALRLDATEATVSGTKLVATAVRAHKARARAIRLAVPARLPRLRYDVVVVAELIYYLSPQAMAQTARDVGTALRPGGTLVMAHHRVDFPDFMQHAAHIQRRFLAATGRRWRVRVVRRTSRWIVISCRQKLEARKQRRVF